jgi:hypothetical protein
MRSRAKAIPVRSHPVLATVFGEVASSFIGGDIVASGMENGYSLAPEPASLRRR